MLRITHINYIKTENKYYIRFAGEPFFSMVDKLKSFGREHAQYKPDYAWPDGKEKAWYIEPDVLECIVRDFSNLETQAAWARLDAAHKSLWEDEPDKEDAWSEGLDKEASTKAWEWTRGFEKNVRAERVRARKAEQEADERTRQNAADWIKKQAEQFSRDQRARFEQEARARKEAEERMRQRQQHRYVPVRVSDALAVLDLSTAVSKDEAKRAYRALMLLHHPDRHALASPSIRQEHEALCKKINVAYEIVVEWCVQEVR